jgi:hypothetical protein
MNNPWEFGWDAIGTIIGILGFIGFIIAEWEKIKKIISIGFIEYLIVFSGMFFVGFSLLQESIFWRLSSLMAVGLYGLLIGNNISQSNVYTQRSKTEYFDYSKLYEDQNRDSSRKTITIILLLGLMGILSGYWFASLL